MVGEIVVVVGEVVVVAGEDVHPKASVINMPSRITDNIHLLK